MSGVFGSNAMNVDRATELNTVLIEKCPRCAQEMRNWPRSLTRCAKCGYEWTMKEPVARTPKTQLQGIKEALDAAATALPVLFTICSKIGLKEGAMAADEILGSIQWAQKELAHMMTADQTTARRCGCNPVDSVTMKEER